MSNSVWFEGVEQLNSLTADLTRVPATAKRITSAAIRKTAFDIRATAQAFAPVDTGTLKGSIGASPIGQDRALRVGDLDAEIGPTVDYGAYVEFGTSQHGPAAYMGPAFDRHAPELEQAIEQIADHIL